MNNFHSVQNSNTMSFHANAELDFWIHRSDGQRVNAAQIAINDFFFNFTFLINGMQVVSNVTQAHLVSIKSSHAVWGNLSSNLVTNMINIVFKFGTPLFNKWWQANNKIMIPNELFGLFRLSDLKVKYYNDFLELGLTPTFLPPKAVESDMDEWYARVSANDEKDWDEEVTFEINEGDTFDGENFDGEEGDDSELTVLQN